MLVYISSPEGLCSALRDGSEHFSDTVCLNSFSKRFLTQRCYWAK